MPRLIPWNRKSQWRLKPYQGFYNAPPGYGQRASSQLPPWSHRFPSEATRASGLDRVAPAFSSLSARFLPSETDIFLSPLPSDNIKVHTSCAARCTDTPQIRTKGQLDGLQTPPQEVSFGIGVIPDGHRNEQRWHHHGGSALVRGKARGRYGKSYPAGCPLEG